MNDAQFDAALAAARAKVEAAGSIKECDRPVQVAVMVVSAQGIIDNGGLEYFYGSDFQEQMPYSEFVDAYRAIGAVEAADLLEQSIQMFPFSSPHLHENQRQAWLAEVKPGSEFDHVSTRLCGHTSVFPKLANYMEQFPAIFGRP